MGETAFNGQSAWMVDGRVTTPGSTAGTTSSDTKYKIYYQANSAQSRVSYLGSESERVSPNPAAATRLENEPAILARYDLTAGQNYSQVTTTTFRAADGTETAGQPKRTTTTYVGRETITVPAGSFATCRFDEREVKDADDSLISTSTTWSDVGTGIRVRATTQTPDGATTKQTDSQLVSATVNGSAVQ